MLGHVRCVDVLPGCFSDELTVTVNCIYEDYSFWVPASSVIDGKSGKWLAVSEARYEGHHVHCRLPTAESCYVFIKRGDFEATK